MPKIIIEKGQIEDGFVGSMFWLSRGTLISLVEDLLHKRCELETNPADDTSDDGSNLTEIMTVLDFIRHDHWYDQCGDLQLPLPYIGDFGGKDWPKIDDDREVGYERD